MQRLGLFVATCGYLGYAPIAPGTFGSAAGLALFFAVRASGSTAVELITIVALFAIGIWSGTVAEHHFGGIDPAPIVLDEVVGMLITLALLPVSGTGAFVGFLVFRVLDVKPFVFLRRSERSTSGSNGLEDCPLVFSLFGKGIA